MTNYSTYQEDIFRWGEDEEGSCFVEGVAGCGKTTTILEFIKRLGGMNSILSLAFNKSIALEMEKKLQGRGEAKTFHGLCYGIMRNIIQQRYGRGKINANNWRTSNVLQRIVDEPLYKKIVMPVGKLVGLAKNLAIMDVDDLRTKLPGLIDYYEVEFKDELWDEVVHWTCEAFIASMDFTPEPGRAVEISFDDMIYLPLYAAHHGETFNWPGYDWVFVDEAQDMNPCQINVMRRMSVGRFVFVGDRAQAIYGFRGSDAAAVDTIVETFNAKCLPLSICYRCPTKVVEHAKQYVPEIEAAPGAAEGEVGEIDLVKFREDAADGELVLCRTNAPLIKECLKLIRDGRKALVKGKDVGDGLKKVVTKASGHGGDLRINLQDYIGKQIETLQKRKAESKIEMLQDQHLTIVALIENIEQNNQTPTVEGIKRLIDTIFVDNPKDGVVFSSIHKAKGLEAGTIWILPSKNRGSKQEWQADQEKNLKYVACTRAQKRLFFIVGE